MEKNIKFTLVIDKLNKKIAELNIKISKNPEAPELKKKLNILLNDKNKLFKGNNIEELENIIKKYESNE